MDIEISKGGEGAGLGEEGGGGGGWGGANM